MIHELLSELFELLEVIKCNYQTKIGYFELKKLIKHDGLLCIDLNQ